MSLRDNFLICHAGAKRSGAIASRSLGIFHEILSVADAPSRMTTLQSRLQ